MVQDYTLCPVSSCSVQCSVVLASNHFDCVGEVDVVADAKVSELPSRVLTWGGGRGNCQPSYPIPLTGHKEVAEDAVLVCTNVIHCSMWFDILPPFLTSPTYFPPFFPLTLCFSSSAISMSVHRIGKTLLIDSFDDPLRFNPKVEK